MSLVRDLVGVNILVVGLSDECARDLRLLVSAQNGNETIVVSRLITQAAEAIRNDAPQARSIQGQLQHLIEQVDKILTKPPPPSLVGDLLRRMAEKDVAPFVEVPPPADFPPEFLTCDTCGERRGEGVCRVKDGKVTCLGCVEEEVRAKNTRPAITPMAAPPKTKKPMTEAQQAQLAKAREASAAKRTRVVTERAQARDDAEPATPTAPVAVEAPAAPTDAPVAAAPRRGGGAMDLVAKPSRHTDEKQVLIDNARAAAAKRLAENPPPSSPPPSEPKPPALPAPILEGPKPTAPPTRAKPVAPELDVPRSRTATRELLARLANAHIFIPQLRSQDTSAMVEAENNGWALEDKGYLCLTNAGYAYLRSRLLEGDPKATKLAPPKAPKPPADVPTFGGG